jgi:hypothetical protein
MSQPPTPYARQYNFAGWSVSNPTTPHQGNKLDQEYNALLSSVNTTISRLSEIQADDGSIRLDTASAAALAAGSSVVLASAATAAVTAAAAAAASGSHTHTISQVSTLQTALDAKASTTSLTSGLAGKANTAHTHAQADITGLTASFAAKANTTHTHTQADITGLTATLAAKVETASQQAPRAWVSFDGTTTPPTIKSSYNVASVSRTNTGVYLITFTNALPDANYCWTASARGTSTSYYTASQSSAGNTQTTTTMNIVTASTTALVNCSLVNVTVFR